METQQPVPDFLQQYIPEGVDPKNFKMEDDKSDFEEEEGDAWQTDGPNDGQNAGTDSWAAGGADDSWGAPAAGGAAADGWGSGPKVDAAGTWGSGGNLGGDSWVNSSNAEADW